MKHDKRETTNTGTEKPPPTAPVYMKSNGESTARKSIKPNGGRTIRYNAKKLEHHQNQT